MGKQGPCYHCGITYTPLWRNGPPEKPVLCNACGSRWRTKGTLANYTPLHARAFEATDSSDYKCGHGKKGLQNPKQQRSNKRKEPGEDDEFGILESDPQYAIGVDEDASNRSSSGSGISYSEGCMQYGGTVGMDNSGSVYPPVWDSPIPSKKRTCMYRKRPSSVVKLMKGLRYILREQDSSYLSGSSEDLLFACKAPMVSTEIGLGSVFIRQPQSVTWEEESEASSLLVENKGYNTADVVTQADSGAVNYSAQLQKEDKYLTEREKVNVKHLQQDSYKCCGPNKVLSENFPYNKHDVLRSCHSPLIFVELEDIVNFDSFVGILTVQEQTELMDYVSSVDIARVPESLQCMFKSVQFEEALTNFQQLLSEGMFEIYMSGLDPQLKQILQKLIVTDLTNSKWIERYRQTENQSKRRRVLDSAKVVQNKISTKEKGSCLSSKSGTYLAVKKSLDWQPDKIITGSDDCMQSPGNPQKSKSANVSHANEDTGCPSKSEVKFDIEPKYGSCFSPSNLFASPLERSSLLDCKGTSRGEGFEWDLLLDVPSNTSFQHTELLHSPVWKYKGYKDSMIDANNLENPNNEEEMASNLWGSEDNIEWSSLFWNSSNVTSGQTLPTGATLYSGKRLP